MAWWSLFGVLAILLSYSLLVLLSTPLRGTITRRIAPVLALNEWHEVFVHLEFAGRTPGGLSVADHAPLDAAAVTGHERVVELGPEATAKWSWRIRPRHRGLLEISAFWLRYELDRLGLVACTLEVPLRTEIPVMPNFRAVVREVLPGFVHRRASFGAHLSRRRGDGLEFHELRDFRPGDSLRVVDWKGVSRRQQLISRDYRDARHQHVLFVLDTSRRMRAGDGTLTLLDHALDAVLALSHVALDSGDLVSAMTFGGTDRQLGPYRGTTSLGALARGLYDVQVSSSPSRYASLGPFVLAAQRRRALVVLITNAADDDNDELLPQLRAWRGRHVVAVASLRPPPLDAALLRPTGTQPEGLSAAFETLGVAAYLRTRERSHALMRARGIEAFDVPPAQLSRVLVQHYLDVKRGGVL
jgi:uncharacterized protein (DUF58 family)